MTEEKKEEQKSDYVNITEDGGIKKKILKEGSGATPEQGNEVHVNYIGRNSDNKVFDQTKDKPFTFKIGSGQEIKENIQIGVQNEGQNEEYNQQNKEQNIEYIEQDAEQNKGQM